MSAITRTPLSVSFCYRKIMRTFTHANLRNAKDTKMWKGRVRQFFEEGIPDRSKEESLTIANEFANLHISLSALMALHERYDIKKLRKLDAGKSAARVGLQLPNVKPLHTQKPN